MSTELPFLLNVSPLELVVPNEKEHLEVIVKNQSETRQDVLVYLDSSYYHLKNATVSKMGKSQVVRQLNGLKSFKLVIENRGVTQVGGVHWEVPHLQAHHLYEEEFQEGVVRFYHRAADKKDKFKERMRKLVEQMNSDLLLSPPEDFGMMSREVRPYQMTEEYSNALKQTVEMMKFQKEREEYEKEQRQQQQQDKKKGNCCGIL